MTHQPSGAHGASKVERVARVTGYVALGLAFIVAIARLVRPDMLQSSRASAVIPIRATALSETDTLANAIARVLSQRIVLHTLQHSDGVRGGVWPAVSSTFTVVPSAGVRGVLGGAVAAGMPVFWRDSTGVRSLVVSATNIPGPKTQTLIAASAVSTPLLYADTLAAGTSIESGVARHAITLRDGGGLLDSVAHTDTSIRLRARQLSGAIRVQVVRNGSTIAVAQSAQPTIDSVHAVRVYAHIGWEAKFVSAALEEDGWHVDGTVAVAPRAQVRTGTSPTLDTSRYSAVIVLDSGVVPIRTLRAFADQGGGVVVSGNALRDPALAMFASVSVRGERLAIAGALLTDNPRRGVAALQLTALRGALPLEADGAWPTMIVSRAGVGRVLASGYHGTWHWRMEGSDAAMDDHRTWWSSIVSTVAYAPAASLRNRDAPLDLTFRDLPGSVAPVADMHAQLGAPVTDFPRAVMSRSVVVPPLWLLVCIGGIALLTEWSMRRLRGAR